MIDKVRENKSNTKWGKDLKAPQSIENKIRSIGEEIFGQMEDESSSIFNKDWWYGQVMDWSMKNEKFKTQMFRFVDVLPYLHSNSEVSRHIKEYFSSADGKLPPVLSVGLGLGALAPGLMAGTIRKNVTQMAKMFIAGESPAEALPALLKAREKGIAFTVDILGEATLSEKEALNYQKKYLDLIHWLAKESTSWKNHPELDSNHLGPIPKVNVSVKVSALYSQINLKAWDETKEVLKERLRPILQIAKEYGVFINLDMEQYALKNLTLEVFCELISEPAFADHPHFGIVIQAYLKDSHADVKYLVAFAKKRNSPITVRLVKGAYWDFETIDAQQKNWEIPVYEVKSACDSNYEDCARTLLENHRHIHSAFASHNVRSLAACVAFAQDLGLSTNSFEIQMLFGMADPIKKALVKMGLRVRQYTPIGDLIPGMAYLVRRLLENTSNESFLRSKFSENVSVEKLLQDPRQQLAVEKLRKNKPRPFENEALLDFAVKSNRDRMKGALEKLENSKERIIPLFIEHKEIFAERHIQSVNPSHPTREVGKVSMANAEHAHQAVESAHRAFATWSRTPSEDRCILLDKLADIMKQKRFELAAMQVLEVGKNWSEADADVAEAIDFCRYYAHQMRQLSLGHRAGNAPGENSRLHHRPRGVCAVIAPWNFPLAILTGMVTAALVAGNTVVIKPAEQSSLVAWQLIELMRAVGFPKEVFQFLPGLGEEVGEVLVTHNKVATIAFTGSRAVGLRILEKASVTSPQQNFVKRALVEMGGKNAIIVDSDADLDEAVGGVLYSAFGFQGQKCSACSRVIVVDEIRERFVERLVEAARSMRCGPSMEPNAFVGPVIDAEAQARILSVIEKNKNFKILFQGEVPTEGYFVPPTIFYQVDPTSALAQEEIFGPVLAVISATNIDEALAIANGTAYALTGGLYSRSPANIEKVKSEFECGNLYINRSITGALVERHPFGGFKLSGAGSKTGGTEYLLHFMDSCVVTENTIRRGFAPQNNSGFAPQNNSGFAPQDISSFAPQETEGSAPSDSGSLA